MILSSAFVVIHAGPGPKKVTVCSQCHGLPIQHDHKTIACGSCRCLSVRLAGLKCGGCIPRGCCKASFQMRNDESNPVLCQDQCGLFFTWVHLPSFAVLLVTRLTSCADVGSSAALKLERIRKQKRSWERRQGLYCNARTAAPIHICR